MLPQAQKPSSPTTSLLRSSSLYIWVGRSGRGTGNSGSRLRIWISLLGEDHLSLIPMICLPRRRGGMRRWGWCVLCSRGFIKCEREQIAYFLYGGCWFDAGSDGCPGSDILARLNYNMKGLHSFIKYYYTHFRSLWRYLFTFYHKFKVLFIT